VDPAAARRSVSSWSSVSCSALAWLLRTRLTPVSGPCAVKPDPKSVNDTKVNEFSWNDKASCISIAANLKRKRCSWPGLTASGKHLLPRRAYRCRVQQSCSWSGTSARLDSCPTRVDMAPDRSDGRRRCEGRSSIHLDRMYPLSPPRSFASPLANKASVLRGVQGV
jgi:hypothetical protein